MAKKKKEVVVLEKEQLEGVEDEKSLPSSEELFDTYKQNLTLASKLVSDMPRNALSRVVRKFLAYPFAEDDVKLMKGEESIFELFTDLDKLKTGMLLNSITAMHKEETQTMVDNMEKDIKGEKSE